MSQQHRLSAADVATMGGIPRVFSFMRETLADEVQSKVTEVFHLPEVLEPSCHLVARDFGYLRLHLVRQGFSHKREHPRDASHRRYVGRRESVLLRHSVNLHE